MANVSMLIAFAAGLLSFLSPCVLPLVPVYLSYLGSSMPERGARLIIFRNASCFVLGFTLVFMAFGASATLLGQFLLRHLLFVRKLAGVMICIFGLYTLGLLPLAFLGKERRWHGFIPRAGGLGAFTLGLAFSAGWTPCIGPVLGAILAYAAQTETLTQGIWLLLSYSLGLGVPFLLAAVLLERFQQLLPLLRRHLGAIKLVTGVLLLLMGILVYFNVFVYLAGLFPYFQF